MAPRPFWKGYLKLSLVTCAVAMQPAKTQSEKVRFHTLNRRTGNRVVSEYVDAVSGETVDDDDQIKGYEREEGDYVLLEDEEIDAVALDSNRTIDIEKFVEADSVDWIWYDEPHYLVPDDQVSEQAFSVIREAMVRTRTHGISRLVMYRRERAVMLVPRGKGIVLWTLRYGDEVRDAAECCSEDDEKPDRRQMDLMKKLIEERMMDWSEDMVSDPVQDRLLDIIKAKKRGRKRAAKAKREEREQPAETGSDNVVSIMDALKNSIEREKGGRKT